VKLPAEIYSTESVRRIDRDAIDVARIDGYTLMKRAAAAALALALQSYPAARRWQIVCGGGNNGGDGYALARLAAEKGIAVTVLALIPPESLQGDAALAWRDFAAAGGPVNRWDGELDADATLLVDAILGSGLKRKVEGRFAEAVEALCRHGAAVLALDIPSGISGDSGEVMGCAVRADRTITFVGLKSGLFIADGPDFVGELSFADLDIPPACREKVTPEMRRIGGEAISRSLAPRPRASHKGDFGHLLLVGGGRGMAGAVRLSGDAALRCGAGLVSIATQPAHCVSVAAGRPELMCHGIERVADLHPLLDRVSTIAIGPGLGKDEWGRQLLDAVLSTGLPLVIDADGLNLLAENPRRRDDWILTPHPGEAARLLGSSPREVQANRLKTLAELRHRYGGVVVLKGAGTLVSAGDDPPWLCTSGNAGMAGPGMGDVLTGVIGSLFAQGLSAEDAAVTGVEVHARAGDTAAGRAPRGLVASDLMPALRTWVNP
jgi:ADP-dependent NAD(P)H-hydrate dehydratase / NAD(P)H-hydrate epimerase